MQTQLNQNNAQDESKGEEEVPLKTPKNTLDSKLKDHNKPIEELIDSTVKEKVTASIQNNATLNEISKALLSSTPTSYTGYFSAQSKNAEDSNPANNQSPKPVKLSNPVLTSSSVAQSVNPVYKKKWGKK